MRYSKSIIFALLFAPIACPFVQSQQTSRCDFRGVVIDSQTEEAIPWVTVTMNGSPDVLTNNDGSFTITIDREGVCEISLSRYGYHTIQQQVRLGLDSQLTEFRLIRARVDPNLATLTGAVVDRNGIPIRWANVFLAGTKIGSLTYADGRFILEAIPPGTFTLKVMMIGYEANEVQVHMTPGETKHYEFELIRKTPPGVLPRRNGAPEKTETL